MSELKPCPFCGERPELYIDEVDLNGSATADSFSYHCEGCDFSRGNFLHIEKAEESWNSRAESTVTEETNRLLNLECEELKKDIDAMKEAIEGAMRISDLWLPKCSFADNPPENYGELESLAIMDRNFQQILDK